MPDIRGLVSDPRFRKLPAGRQRTLLLKTGAEPAFIDRLVGVSPELESQREAIVAAGTHGALERSADPSLAAAKRATESTMQDPEALAAGYLGSTGPATAAGVLGTVVPAAIPARVLGAGLGAYQGGKRGGPVGAVAGGVMGAARPLATGAIGGALEGYDVGGLPGAVGGAMLGGAPLLGFLRRFKSGGSAAAKAAQMEAARLKGQEAAAKTIKSLGMTPVTEFRAAQAAKAAQLAEAETAAAAPVASAAQATAPGSPENLLLRLKDMNSTAAGRAQLLDYIKAQPPEIARELRARLGPAVRHRVGVK